jgi:putative component of toxin-antitoxin plasmid stabilization module
MIEIRQTEIYVRWFDSLRDRQARARITFGSDDYHWETQAT